MPSKQYRATGEMSLFSIAYIVLPDLRYKEFGEYT